MTVLVPSALAADMPPPPGLPTILFADANGTTLLITGVNFGTATRPIVRLGGTALSVADGFSSTAIVATIRGTFGPGSYPLWVETFFRPPPARSERGHISGFRLVLLVPRAHRDLPGQRGQSGAEGRPCSISHDCSRCYWRSELSKLRSSTDRCERDGLRLQWCAGEGVHSDDLRRNGRILRPCSGWMRRYH